MRDYSDAFAQAVMDVIGPWAEQSMRAVFHGAHVPIDDEIATRINVVQTEVVDQVGQAFHALMNTDIDQQRTTPLEVIRAAVPLCTALLADYNLAPVQRDSFAQQQFPGDLYGLTPHHISDIDESLREPALVWGAAKAHVHLQRHQHKRRNATELDSEE